MEPALYTEDDRFRALLERWIEGDVTAAEERELFRLAQQDAFRQAALDGYLQFPETDHDTVIRELQARIQRPASPGLQIFPWWLAVAAAMALLLAGWWFWPVQEQASGPVAAAEEKTMEMPEQIPDTVPLAMRSEHTAAPPAPAPAADPARATKKSKSDAPVTIQPGSPAGAADIAAAEEAVSAKPLPPADAAPTRSAPMATQMPAGKAAEPQKEKAAPEVWWQDLQRYLRTNARLTPEARNNNISGSVRLRGRLQPDGQLTAITFEETLGYGLEKQALLLMQGFNWPIGKDTVLEIDVRFVR
ncbi:MAG: hypothetical protein SFV52_12515 [Saprospiraceae bacterium]|nr:hypothetical protein [Saprospiraceae bacterium]